jgi:hypothetical protein
MSARSVGRPEVKLHTFLHQGVHIGRKPYEFMECGKALSNGSYLVQHERLQPAKGQMNVFSVGNHSDRGHS